jgi:hypothetical protein
VEGGCRTPVFGFVAEGLIGPTGLVFDSVGNQPVLAETFTGAVLTFPLGG